MAEKHHPKLEAERVARISQEQQVAAQGGEGCDESTLENQTEEADMGVASDEG